MATITSLASELLSHIHCLSVENAPPSERQAARHRFVLVGRAFFLALADPTEFHVDGAIQACHFWEKLEQEKKWEDLVASNKPKMTRTESKLLRTTRGTTNIRRLVLIADRDTSDGLGRIFENIILCAKETNLVALDLDLRDMSEPSWTTLAAVEGVLRGLTGLRELSIRTRPDALCQQALLRILLPLQSLEVLEVPYDFLGRPEEYDEDISKLSFPRLHTLRVPLCYYDLHSFGDTLLAAVGHELRTLDLGSTDYYLITTDSVKNLISSVTNVIHLIWVPRPENLRPPTRNSVVALLAGMKKVETVAMSAWTCSQEIPPLMRSLPYHEYPMDPTLLATFATLPRLHSVEITMMDGKLDEDHLISFIKSQSALRYFCVLHQTGRDGQGWAQEQRARVQEAAVEAGVVFKYKVWSIVVPRQLRS